MPLQAEHCVQILMALYQELDQRSGWADPAKIVALFKAEGVAEGRTNDALQTLKNLQMVEEQNSESGSSIKMSRYGVTWFEKNFTLTARSPNYEYALPLFGRVNLMGPDEFYKRGRRKAPPDHEFNWTKWGTIIGALGLLATILIAVLS